MKKGFLILFLMILLASCVQAQDTLRLPRFRIGVEAGASILYAETNKPAMIRESQYYYNDYDYNYSCGFIPEGQDFTLLYAGLKLEYSLSKRFVIGTGARFSYSQIVLDSDQDYFLWKISEDELHTNYVKIKEVSQDNYYVGIPLSVRFFPNEKDYPVRHYFTAGTVLDFLVASNEDVSFSNSAMEKYKPQVLDQIGKPNVFQGYFFAGFGLKFGRMKHPFGNFEIHFPVFRYGTNDENSLIKNGGSFGVEFQTSFQIPIFKKRQLTYTVTD